MPFNFKAGSQKFSLRFVPDVWIGIFFLFILSLLFLSDFNRTSPFVWSTDNEVISSIAAAKDHPSLFSNDYVYGEARNYLFYTPFFVEFVRWGCQLFGQYRFSFKILTVWIVLFHLWGYYLLGFSISRNKMIGLLYSLLVLCPVHFRYEMWGFEGEHSATARNLFSAFLPIILILFFDQNQTHKKWLFMTALSGFMVYIHPASAPVVGLASIMGYVAAKLFEHWDISWKKIILAICVWLVIILPYGIWYGIFHAHGQIPESLYLKVQYVMRMRFDPLWFNPIKLSPLLFWLLISRLSVSFILVVPAIGWGLYKKEHHTLIRRLLILMASILVVSVFIPILEHSYCRMFQLIPFELDLIRNLRYLVPLLYLGFPILWMISQSFSSHLKIFIRIISCTVVVLGISLKMPPPIVRYIKSHVVYSLPFPPPAIALNIKLDLEAMKAVNTWTPPTSNIMGDPMAIRYVSLRPLYFNHKDGNILSYSNWEGLLEWYRRQFVVNKIKGMKNHESQINLLKKEKIDYWLATPNSFSTDAILSMKAGHRIVWANEKYLLIKIRRTHDF